MIDSTLPAADTEVQDYTGLTFHGRYQLLRQLGRGGMGEVWLAEHLSLGIKVALKMMHPVLAAVEENNKRFALEAKALSMLNHPNVVRVLDFGSQHGTSYLVMEFLLGTPLANRIDDAPEPFPLSFVFNVMLQMSDAIGALHDIDIVHRDLKPDNIFLTMDHHGEPVVKLVDFGLAHVSQPGSERLTATSTLAGTPPYMSPEQCRSLRVGPSADLYSLGCILTELLQLRPPFNAPTPIDIISRHLFSPPPSLDRPAGSEPVPALLERLRLDLLAKSPELRPATAADVRERLLEAMDYERAAELLPDRSGAHIQARDVRAKTSRPPRATDVPARGLVRVERLGNAGLDASFDTAIESQGYTLAPGDPSAQVVVLDAVTTERAEAWLEDAQPLPTTIVCVASATAEELSRLIALGAGAVLLYPVQPDALLKKLEGAMRRADKQSRRP